MNDEMVSKTEFLRRMGYEPYGENHAKLKDIMRGVSSPRKNWIDGMLAVTGMSYEMMFSDTLWGIDDE